MGYGLLYLVKSGDEGDLENYYQLLAKRWILRLLAVSLGMPQDGGANWRHGARVTTPTQLRPPTDDG